MKMPPKTTAVTPHLTVRDVEAATSFYEAGLGFSIKFKLPGQGGKIMHAEVGHAGCTIMIGPESPERGIQAPITSGTTPPVSIYVYVDDVDAAHARAVGAGAVELLPPSDQFFGAKTSVIADPDGHQWMLAEHQKEMSGDELLESLKGAAEGEGAAHSAAAPRRGPDPSGRRRRPYRT